MKAIEECQIYSIPAAFREKKQRIVAALAIPDADYLDLSPKGSVDDGIRDLINEINSFDGFVTTSSCAGRISVFLEGNKLPKQTSSASKNHEVELKDEEQHKSVPGGKGKGGRWLFVSHDAVAVPQRLTDEDTPVTRLFGLSSQKTMSKFDSRRTRLVRFQFEPMILHIMTASLRHAGPVLSAAINAGFRESGVQSLKNLNDTNAFPMVAVRTSGLAFESLIGGLDEENGIEAEILSFVGEQYLETLLKLGNERFLANAERIERFRGEMIRCQRKDLSKWEDEDRRRERKRAEGLKRQESKQAHSIEDRMDQESPDERDNSWPCSDCPAFS